MRNLEEQMRDIFGPGFDAKKRAEDTQLDNALDRDLKAFLDTPTEVLESISSQIEAYSDNYNLSHSQLAAVLVGIIVNKAQHCPVANYVGIRTLEVTLREMLDKTAEGSGMPVNPLLEATVQRIVGSNAEVVGFTV